MEGVREGFSSVFLARHLRVLVTKPYRFYNFISSAIRLDNQFSS